MTLPAMTTTTQTAAAANEYKSRIGQDLCPAFELSDWEEEQEAEAERLEAEGRAEMLHMLDLGGY